MKKFLALLLTLTMAMSIAACSANSTIDSVTNDNTSTSTQTPTNSSPAEGEIILGCITTGTAVPTYTETVTNMAILAAEQINAKGGVLGKKVKVVFESGEASADEYVNAANRLLSRGDIVATVGCATSTGVLAVESLYKKAQVPILAGGTSVKIKSTVNDNDYLFCCRASDQINAGIGAQYLVNKLGCKNLGVIYVNNDFGQGGLSVVQDYCRENNIPLTAEGFNESDTDVTSQTLKLKEAGVDGIVLWAVATNLPMIAQAFYNNGLRVPVIGPTAISLAESFENCDPEWIDGWYSVTDFCMSKEDAELQALIKEYYERFGNDAYLSADGLTVYREVLFVCDIINEIGTTDGPALAKALRETPGKTYLGTTFKAQDKFFMMATVDVTQNSVQNGKIVNNYIETYTAD